MPPFNLPLHALLAASLAAVTPSPAAPTPPDPAWPATAAAALQAWQNANSPATQLAALTSLAPIARQHPLVLVPLTTSLTSGEVTVRAQLLRLFAETGSPAALPAAREAVVAPHPLLAAAAAEALATLQPPTAQDDLLAVFQLPAPPHAATRQAVVTALARTVPQTSLAALHQHPNPDVRHAALDALSLEKSPRAEAFLSDSAPHLAELAAFILYENRHEGAWPALVTAGCSPATTLPAAGQHRAFAAAWNLGRPHHAQQLAAWLAATPPAPNVDTSLPRTALRLLLAWDTPPEEDPVQPPRPFRPRPRPAATAWTTLQQHSAPLAAWAAHLGGEEAAAWKNWSARLAAAPQTPAASAAFLADPARPEGERLHHLRSRLAASSKPDATTLATAALASPETPSLRTEARTWLFRQQTTQAVPWLLQSLAIATPAEKQAAIRLLDHHPSSESQTFLLQLLSQATRSQVDPAVTPEIVEAIERRTRSEGPESRPLRDALDAWRATQQPTLGHPLRPWSPALQPGDAEAGHSLFFSHLTRCAACHHPATNPPPAAPSLDGISTRLSPPQLLQSLVQPAKINRPDPPPATTPATCPPVGTLLTVRELRNLVAYLRSLP